MPVTRSLNTIRERNESAVLNWCRSPTLLVSGSNSIIRAGAIDTDKSDGESLTTGKPEFQRSLPAFSNRERLVIELLYAVIP